MEGRKVIWTRAVGMARNKWLNGSWRTGRVDIKVRVSGSFATAAGPPDISELLAVVLPATPLLNIMWVARSVLLLNIILISNAAVPDPPTARTTTIGARKLATAEDCSGVVAFAASHGNVNNARVVLSETLVDKGVGYVATTGTFTTHCPGLYQFSFAGYGSSDLRLTLKRKESSATSWSPVISVGPGGGSNLVLLDMEAGDQLAVFVESGKISDGATFTGHRIAKK